jgi:nucleoside-diphosphate-sugar epimerase
MWEVEEKLKLIRAKLFGGKKIYVPKRRKEISRSLADIKKIKNHLNWTPKIMIEEGTRDFLNFYKIKDKKI